MKTRELDSECIIRKEERTSDGLVYKYELRMRKTDRNESSALPLYSVSVILSRADGEVLTRAETGGIFSSEVKALDFFAKITDNLATPINLPFILEDMLSV